MVLACNLQSVSLLGNGLLHEVSASRNHSNLAASRCTLVLSSTDIASVTSFINRPSLGQAPFESHFRSSIRKKVKCQHEPILALGRRFFSGGFCCASQMLRLFLDGLSKINSNRVNQGEELFPSPETLTQAVLEMDFGGKFDSNIDLVQHLKAAGVVESPEVVRAMEDIDRVLFVNDLKEAYSDFPQPIGHNATISAPHMHALCLELLADHLQPGMKALDVGSGSGYLSACMAQMVGVNGRVVGIEHIPELVVRARRNVSRSIAEKLLDSGVLSFVYGDGRQGYAPEAPFNAIHVGAAAEEVPSALVNQLMPGGRIVVPVGRGTQQLLVVDKGLEGEVTETSLKRVRYVPLTSWQAQVGGNTV